MTYDLDICVCPACTKIERLADAIERIGTHQVKPETDLMGNPISEPEEEPGDWVCMHCGYETAGMMPTVGELLAGTVATDASWGDVNIGALLRTAGAVVMAWANELNPTAAQTLGLMVMTQNGDLTQMQARLVVESVLYYNEVYEELSRR